MRHLPFFMVAFGLTVACGSARRPAYERELEGNQPNTGEDPGTGNLGTSSGTAPAPACAAIVSDANRAQVDVIVVIDTSGSMDDETNQVKQNLNNFAQSIGNTGLDYNVIMIARKPGGAIFGIPLLGICVQPPLAGADCADGPKFHHLNVPVESTDSLKILIDKYADWSGWLRQNAYKVFIEVTDDDSTDKSWDTFDSQLLAKSPQQFGDSTTRRYIFNSICGYKRNTAILSSEMCGSAMNIGEQYQRLSQLTGGIVDSVCESSYASVFDNIAKGLVTKLGCEFSIPVGENGQETDPTTVVVTYTPGDGTPAKPLTQVTDASKCGANPDGWHYDNADAPTKILFCPSTCSGPGADTAGKLAVAVGCKAPPPK